MAEINLPLHKNSPKPLEAQPGQKESDMAHPRYYDIEGEKVRHWASQDKWVDDVKWAKGIDKDSWKKLPDHSAVYARHTVKNHPKEAGLPCFVIKDDDEIHLYRIES